MFLLLLGLWIISLLLAILSSVWGSSSGGIFGTVTVYLTLALILYAIFWVVDALFGITAKPTKGEEATDTDRS